MKWHLVWKNAISRLSLGFWIPLHGFRILCQRELGFRIPIFSGIPDSLSCLPAKAKDCGCHWQIPAFQNLDNFPYSPYMWQRKLCVSYIGLV